MPHTIRSKKQLLNRIRRIQGQSVALEKALEQEKECTEILQQIAALRGAVNGLMSEVLEGHITEHLGESTSPKQRKEDLEQLVRILKSYLR